MHVEHLRHATYVVDAGVGRLLVDPMLSRAEAMDPVGNAESKARIPMVELPVDDKALAALVAGVDAVLVTHTHRDHWDARAVELISKDKLILCQPEDAPKMSDAGFTNVTAVSGDLEWRGVRISRTGGQHGTGEIGKLMGTVSGFVLRTPDAPVLYLAGDTIWCDEIEQALAEHAPDAVVVNAGAAQFLTGDPITMSDSDIARVCEARPKMQVIAVHLDTINHCWQTRDKLRAALDKRGITRQVLIPADGQSVPIVEQ